MEEEQKTEEKFQQQDFKPSLWQKFKRFIIECKRVLTVTKKPTGDEFKTIVKVSGIGILLIGLLGFLVQLIKQVLF